MLLPKKKKETLSKPRHTIPLMVLFLFFFFFGRW